MVLSRSSPEIRHHCRRRVAVGARDAADAALGRQPSLMIVQTSPATGTGPDSAGVPAPARLAGEGAGGGARRRGMGRGAAARPERP